MSVSQASNEDLFSTNDSDCTSLAEKAKTDPSIRITNNGIKLLDLPIDILTNIFGMVVDEHTSGHQELDISVSRNLVKRFYGGERFPEAFNNLKGLIRLDTRTRDLVARLVGVRFQFINKIPDSFYNLPNTFGYANCRCITQLVFEMDEGIDRAKDRIWPGIFAVLRNNLPLLRHFELGHWFTNSANLSKEEIAEKYALLVHFMSCLLPGHRTLRRAILPAESGPSFEPNGYGWEYVHMFIVADRGCYSRPGDMSRKWKTGTKWTDFGRTTKFVEEDQVLNTQAARLLTVSELKRTPMSDLLVLPHKEEHKDDIWTSELPGGTFTAIDKRAYLLPRLCRKKFGWGYRSHERLVKMCRRGQGA